MNKATKYLRSLLQKWNNEEKIDVKQTKPQKSIVAIEQMQCDCLVKNGFLPQSTQTHLFVLQILVCIFIYISRISQMISILFTQNTSRSINKTQSRRPHWISVNSLAIKLFVYCWPNLVFYISFFSLHFTFQSAEIIFTTSIIIPWKSSIKLST